jgi:hypothetical protein
LRERLVPCRDPDAVEKDATLLAVCSHDEGVGFFYLRNLCLPGKAPDRRKDETERRK